MNEIYETKISNARWIVYDILGNAGWIIWFICTALSLKDGVSVFSVLTCLPAVVMLIGIAELISERIATFFPCPDMGRRCADRCRACGVAYKDNTVKESDSMKCCQCGKQN